MKLPNQTQGPVTLSRIDYSPRLSEETFAFAADITIVVNGKTLKGTVENAGHGGDNNIHPREVHDAVEAYAKTLPHEPSPYSAELYPQSYDSLISDLVAKALEAKDNVKWVKKGFTHVILVGDRGLYTKGAPAPAQITAFAAKYKGTAEVRALA